MKLTYVIQIYKSMFYMKNGLNSVIILYTGSHKRFSITFGLWGWQFLKHILANLYWTKFNGINIFLWDVLINYGLYFEKAENVFSVVFHGFNTFQQS